MSTRILGLWTAALALLAGPAQAESCERAQAAPNGDTVVPPACIAQAVERDLRRRWEAGSERMTVDVALPAQAVKVPMGQLSFEVQLAPGLALQSRVPVRLRVSVDGRPVASLAVWATVSVWATVQRARAGLPRGALLQPGLLAPVLVDVAALNGAPWQSASAPERLRAPLSAGQVVMRRDVGAVALVSRDERVQLRFARGGITLETEVIADGDAGLGDPLTVRAPGSREVLQAVVVGPKTVALRE